jgi:hypothetical protein
VLAALTTNLAGVFFTMFSIQYHTTCNNKYNNNERYNHTTA